MSPVPLIFTGLLAVYIVTSTALLFVRNTRALRALERFAPRDKGRRSGGWGYADVEVAARAPRPDARRAPR